MTFLDVSPRANVSLTCAEILSQYLKDGLLRKDLCDKQIKDYMHVLLPPNSARYRGSDTACTCEIVRDGFQRKHLSQDSTSRCFLPLMSSRLLARALSGKVEMPYLTENSSGIDDGCLSRSPWPWITLPHGRLAACSYLQFYFLLQCESSASFVHRLLVGSELRSTKPEIPPAGDCPLTSLWIIQWNFLLPSLLMTPKYKTINNGLFFPVCLGYVWHSPIGRSELWGAAGLESCVPALFSHGCVHEEVMLMETSI